ncbi:heterogeneous nuclear ribonucleoprotein 1-like isoform X2 [Phoenix dactylifera]|uniref:Heterogeneous nuclear ribonucleoprotein 1-like isoform X2 n=1 Tax=Phoenix dactylifera TaxID=42345 RepID=A0A8B7BP66_PHODC|nr:heterogeneous nuclear ribonucleoprotein 1-like isoform X2 [Phoenix dactylifera]
MFELVLDFDIPGSRVSGWSGSHVGPIKCRWGDSGKQKITLIFSCVIEKSSLEESRGTQLRAQPRSLRTDSDGVPRHNKVPNNKEGGWACVEGFKKRREETFSKHFEKYGEITDSVIMKDKHTHMPRGFGFVTFADPSVVDNVLEDEHVIDGRMVEVKRTVPRGDLPSKAGLKTKKIFVGGIPLSLTEDELKEHFASYGKVIEHQIMLDHSTGRSRGFGFVTFENEEAVKKIISEGRMHNLGGKQVEIKRAEPKKAGGDPGNNGRVGHGTGVGIVPGFYRGGTYGYGGGYRSGGIFYGGNYDYGYGGVGSYGAGFSSSYGGRLYGSGRYGSGTAYGGPAGFNGVYGGYGGRGYGRRYHPYGK